MAEDGQYPIVLSKGFLSVSCHICEQTKELLNFEDLTVYVCPYCSERLNQIENIHAQN